MKLITFSLWGNNPMYTIGAIKNAELARTLYPDWTCLFYCSRTVPIDIVNKLSSMSNVAIRNIEGDGDKKSAMCRFFPAEENGVEYMISRDCDSRLSMREVLAVNDWMQRDTDLHLMRDHPHHSGHPILAGMWGTKGGVLKGIKEAAETFTNRYSPDYKAQDQDFLAYWIWPKVERKELSITCHDSFFLNSPFPSEAKRGDGNGGVFFVGQVFDENDKNFFDEHIEMLKRYGVCLTEKNN